MLNICLAVSVSVVDLGGAFGLQARRSTLVQKNKLAYELKDFPICSAGVTIVCTMCNSDCVYPDKNSEVIVQNLPSSLFHTRKVFHGQSI